MVEQILNFSSVKEFLDNIDENSYNLLIKWKDNPEITNDEKLAALFNTKVTVIRSILNKLSFRGIVTFDKVKDKNSGWYDYYWKVDYDKLAKLIYARHKDKKEKLEEKLDVGNDYNMFSCINECKVLPFEVSAEYNFSCPHCSAKLEYYDYSKKVKEIESYIGTINMEMEYIRYSLNKKQANNEK